VIKELSEFGVDVVVHDPWVNSREVTEKYDFNLTLPQLGDDYDAILIAVAHMEFKQVGLDVMRSYGRPGAIVMDLKGIFRTSPNGDGVLAL
jgi:UDP-N-acetyl-D-galactosamine dehydrogenase